MKNLLRGSTRIKRKLSLIINTDYLTILFICIVKYSVTNVFVWGWRNWNWNWNYNANTILDNINKAKVCAVVWKYFVKVNAKTTDWIIGVKFCTQHLDKSRPGITYRIFLFQITCVKPRAETSYEYISNTNKWLTLANLVESKVGAVIFELGNAIRCTTHVWWLDRPLANLITNRCFLHR